MGQGEIYYKKVVKPLIHLFMGPVFENMCRYYTLKHGIQNEFGSFITNVGSWWGSELIVNEYNEKKVQSADIDVVGISPLDKSFIVGECKFKNEKVDKNVYLTLVRRAKLIKTNYKLTKYILFSLSGFTNYFTEKNDNDLILISLDMMY